MEINRFYAILKNLLIGILALSGVWCLHYNLFIWGLQPRANSIDHSYAYLTAHVFLMAMIPLVASFIFLSYFKRISYRAIIIFSVIIWLVIFMSLSGKDYLILLYRELLDTNGGPIVWERCWNIISELMLYVLDVVWIVFLFVFFGESDLSPQNVTTRK